MRLLLLGPPGAGKGTQAVAMAERFGVPAISTGDIFRANVARRTELGRTAQRYLEAGEYVPDEVTNAMLGQRLSEPDCADGFLLDGYPRTLQQVAELDAILERDGAVLGAVVLLDADPDELVRRLLLRARDQGRADDTEAVIRRRLEVYAAETAPLAAEYAGRGLLATVDGLGSVDEVAERIVSALAAASSSVTR
ncbi:adenylate kinase [Nocardioides daeguensis]|uniref:Adenylate kinase n=1 Tax=Nocardioides daeguensis TaxID=908359 RepID=A0ABP6V4I0_9ACTN|nr:adenylate kinase [Nocardioides daeguensis]MBV6726464.1 adenylate kinase [Nocardioides daeguensis]MCR1772307.1 adenylate kinase [Nocardioides daeguensis]